MRWLWQSAPTSPASISNNRPTPSDPPPPLPSRFIRTVAGRTPNCRSGDWNHLAQPLGWGGQREATGFQAFHAHANKHLDRFKSKQPFTIRERLASNVQYQWPPHNESLPHAAKARQRTVRCRNKRTHVLRGTIALLRINEGGKINSPNAGGKRKCFLAYHSM